MAGAVLAAASVLGIAAMAPAAAAATTPMMPTPLGGQLHSPPTDLADHALGDVLFEQTREAPFGVIGDVRQLQFRSSDSAGDPIAAVVTVFTPPQHQPDGPVLVYEEPYNALGLECAPSNAFWSPKPEVVMRDATAFDAALAAGWSVAIPDYLGPKSAYGAARLGGQITLDAVRAVQRTPDLRLDHSPVALAGYSGGAMAAGWAATLAPTYAPELNLVGAAIGGVPVNILQMAEELGHTHHPAFGLAAAVAFGLEREYGAALPLSSFLSEEGRRYRAAINDACTNQILVSGAGRSVDELGTSFELFYQDQTRKILRDNSLEFSEGAPQIPVYLWRGVGDPFIGAAETDATVANWRSHGTPVTYVTVPAIEHLSGAAVGLPDAVRFLFTAMARAGR
ncbi:lipase family protein [Nocardia tengchongensis]|uniref:lipase family protein n=1 Tax=Nocardia tengchongensis TaxID=2055889 RepID=UPI003688FAF5